MKKITLVVFTITIMACSVTKKQKQDSVVKNEGATTTTVKTESAPSTFTLAIPNSDGVYEPGDREVDALKANGTTVSIDHLNKGYQLYAKTACIECHSAKNIYKIPSSEWSAILDNMAIKAKLADDQREAINLYVLSIKAAGK